MRRVGYGDSQLPISQLWRTGKLVCACGGPGDHLAVRSAPAGMAPRVLALWRWGDGGLWPSPEPDSGARLRYTSAMLATATTDRWAALLVREPR